MRQVETITRILNTQKTNPDPKILEVLSGMIEEDIGVFEEDKLDIQKKIDLMVQLKNICELMKENNTELYMLVSYDGCYFNMTSNGGMDELDINKATIFTKKYVTEMRDKLHTYRDVSYKIVKI